MDTDRRLSRLEAGHAHQKEKLDHVDHHLSKLSEAYTDMAKTMANLVAHQEEVQRMGEQMREVQQHLANHNTEIAVLQRDVEPVSDMAKKTDRNATVTGAVKWFLASLVAATLGTLGYIIREIVTNGS